MYEILQVLNVALFEELDISQALTETPLQSEESIFPKQLLLFDF